MIYLLLFLEFFKIGLFTFGGGYAMIPLLKEVVLKYNWVSEAEFYDFIGVCESTPGPIAINMATFVGATQGGFLGSVVSTFAVVLPSFIIILLIATFLNKFLKNKYFQRVLSGIKPVIIGLIVSTGLLLLLKVIGFNSDYSFNVNWVSIIIFVLIVIIYFVYKLIFKKKINTILLIVISAGLGIGLNMLFLLF